MNYLPEQLDLWMSLAIEQAQQAQEKDEVPVGALLISNGEILSTGLNLRETTHRTTAHAEIVALENYSERTGQWRVPLDTTLIVTVEPCLMCTGALLWARASNIVYGCEDTRNAGLRRVQPLIDSGVYDHRFQSVISGVRGGECATLMSNYFKKKRI